MGSLPVGRGRPVGRRRAWLLMPLVMVLAEPSPAQQSGLTLRIGIARGSGHSITEMPLERYVARVLAGEAAAETPDAALDALAVSVRTYALANLNRHEQQGFDLCDQTHCQVLRVETLATERAAMVTAGRVLLHDGRPAEVFYGAACGGHTESPSSVWPGAADPPHLPARPDPACGGGPSWISVISASDLARALAAAGIRGNVRGIRVVSRAPSGRVAQLVLEGATPSRISGTGLRAAVLSALGPQALRSTAFDVRREGGGYRFSGRGSGHGVGLCLLGAVRLAEGGGTIEAILGHYFPGLAVGAPRQPTATAVATPASEPAARAADPPVGIDVQVAGEASDRVELIALAERARADLARVLAVPPPPELRIRVHGSTAEYEAATGRRWFTAAAVQHGAVHLVPLEDLRQRGVLDRMVRREIVRLMVDDVLVNRPMWVREGVPLHFADPSSGQAAPPQEPRGGCPSDVELAYPTSPGALSDAYTRARACVARQIASGRSWQTVR